MEGCEHHNWHQISNIHQTETEQKYSEYGIPSDNLIGGRQQFTYLRKTWLPEAKKFIELLEMHNKPWINDIFSNM